MQFQVPKNAQNVFDSSGTTRISLWKELRWWIYLLYDVDSSVLVKTQWSTTVKKLVDRLSDSQLLEKKCAESSPWSSGEICWRYLYVLRVNSSIEKCNSTHQRWNNWSSIATEVTQIWFQLRCSQGKPQAISSTICVVIFCCVVNTAIAWNYLLASVQSLI